MRTLEALQNIRGAIERPSLTGLKSAQQVAAHVRLPAARVREMAEAMFLPHFRIAGGEPLFNLPSLKRYVQRYMTVVCDGAPLPLNLQPIVLTPATTEIPLAQASVRDRLAECPAVNIPPCMHFLIAAGSIVYVGQRWSLASRLLQHIQAGKRWDRVLFMPIAESELFRIEAHWISALQPPLNQRTLSKDNQT